MMRLGAGRVKLPPVLSAEALRRALGAAGLEAPVRYEREVGSTNDLARQLAARGAPEWTLVAADHQTAGRGRAGRRWVDRPGEGLLFSLVLRPRGLAPVRAGLLALLAGVAAAEASAAAGGPPCRCKWPNDLLVGGAKAGGILAEALVERDALRHVVLGVGLNLGEAGPEVPGEPRPATLGPLDPEAVLAAFLRSFHARYTPAHPAFARAVLDAYRERSDTLGRRVRVEVSEGRAVTGLAVDLDDRGGLVVEHEGERVTVSFGDVIHLREP
jgi:BirA family biotin operon repressor/biotin-[acetyl-CoA-carboxylase] ligase